eukprot:UN4874
MPPHESHAMFIWPRIEFCVRAQLAFVSEYRVPDVRSIHTRSIPDLMTCFASGTTTPGQHPAPSLHKNAIIQCIFFCL